MFNIPTPVMIIKVIIIVIIIIIIIIKILIKIIIMITIKCYEGLLMPTWLRNLSIQCL